jgi:hypothetical protein
MKRTILGVIAITSTLMFACTMTKSTTTDGEGVNTAPGPAPYGAGVHTARPKLELTRPGSHAAAIAALAGGRHGPVGSHVLLGGDAGACGLSSGDPTCDACVASSCCAEDTACASDADCTALITCGDACMDDTCFSACFAAHPTGASILDKLSTCVEGSCGTACGGPPQPPPGSACGFATGDATCDTCLGTSCCAQANACFGDADCTALLDCGDACNDSTCLAACEAAHPSGAAKISAISTCVDTTCGAACGGTPGLDAGSGPGPAPGPSPGSCGLTSSDPTCDACLDASCCAESTACVDDPQCVALVSCYDACTDDACATACDAAHPAGTAHLNAVFGCVQTNCATSCGP